jgi:ABC-type branched-subunit amino acid transport system substrate-binding protein
VTDTTITIGANYVQDANAVANSIGVSNVNTQDGRTLAQVVVDDLNAHGGVAGRKLQVVWHPRQYNSQETYDAQDQEACADFTQDHKVFAAIAAGARANFLSCMHKAGSAVIGGANSTSVDTTAHRYPYYVESDSLGWSRQMRSLVPALKQGGYFSPGYKLGVLSYDTPGGHEVVDRTLNPALKAVGAKASEVAYLPPNQSFADNGPNVQQLQGIVLKFQSEGITHVLMLAVDGGLPLIFSRVADGQHYRPRYAVTSIWGLSAVSSDYADGQLDGAMGIGWMPALDYVAKDDATASSAERKRCIAVYRARGISQQNAADLQSQLEICQLLWFFRDAVQAAGVISRDGLLAGAAKLGRRDSPATYGTQFVRGHTDGAYAVQPLKYVGDCTCFRPTGPVRPAL